RRSKTVIEEVAQSKEVAEYVDSEDTDEEPPMRGRPTGVVIGGEVHSESDDEGLSSFKEASRHDFFIQQRPRGSGKGSGVTLEVPDELTLKSSNEGASVTLEVLDEPIDHSSSSSSDLEFTVEDISSDEADITEKADKAKNTETEKGTDEKAKKEHAFLNDNHDVTINEVLKDPSEPEVQSMVDVPVTQAKPVDQIPLLVDIIVILLHESKTPYSGGPG
nr:hypothetical protein [Tanacetum cinerariifolium]